MSNRKENHKKTLGISQYSWSSDDEEETITDPPEPAYAELIGMPVISSATSPTNRGEVINADRPLNQATNPDVTRRDRDTFWSIINNQPRNRWRQTCDLHLLTAANVGARIRNTNELNRIGITREQNVNSTSGTSTGGRSTTSSIISNIAGPSRPNNTHRASLRVISKPKLKPKINANVDLWVRLFNNQSSESRARRTLATRANALNDPTRTNQTNPQRSLNDTVIDDSEPRTLVLRMSTNEVSPHSTQCRPHHTPLLRPSATTDQTNSQQTLNDIYNGNHINVLHPVPLNTPSPNPSTSAEFGQNLFPGLATIIEEHDDAVVAGPSSIGVPLKAEVLTLDSSEEISTNGEGELGTAGDTRPNGSEQTTSVFQTGQPQGQGTKRKRESTSGNNEPETVKEFNQILLRMLECPVCLEWMSPPIAQCRRGHLVCSACRGRLSACPVCRTAFSSVRNRAMEGVADVLRYPCRHGCGREVRLRKRGPHEASCSARLYKCPLPACSANAPLPHDALALHFQSNHDSMLKYGNKHKLSLKVNSNRHENWIVMALDEFFHLRIDTDVRTWGIVVYVAYIGPKKRANAFTYQVVVEGKHHSRRNVYTRTTHSDLENMYENMSRHDCFHLTLDQALNFLRFKNRNCEPDKNLELNLEINKCEQTSNISVDESDS